MVKTKNNPPRYKQSDHYDGHRFYNPTVTIRRGLKSLIKMLYQDRKKGAWPTHIENRKKPNIMDHVPEKQANITYINHATHLIQLHHLNILTDPVFSKRVSPLRWLGPKRVRDPGMTINALPPIHTVLISHNHYDHMDLPTIKQLEKKFQPLFIVPLGNENYLRRNKILRVIELDWWQSYSIHARQSITLVPAQHWSMRYMGDANKALWGGFWIQSNLLSIYFSGDTGYGPHFKQIQQKLGTPTISILPIGAYEPRWFMKLQHMNPEEAVLASLDLKSPLNIATHHGTFRLSHELVDEPVIALKESLRKHHVSEKVFIAPENGETIIYHL